MPGRTSSTHDFKVRSRVTNQVKIVLAMAGVGDSIIEHQRKLHEERERVEDALVKERALKKPSV